MVLRLATTLYLYAEKSFRRTIGYEDFRMKKHRWMHIMRKKIDNRKKVA